jgi:hypothetical protein
VVPIGFNPRPGGETAREGVEVVPQVVGDGFRELLWESAHRGSEKVFILRKARSVVLIEREFQSKERVSWNRAARAAR